MLFSDKSVSARNPTGKGIYCSKYPLFMVSGVIGEKSSAQFEIAAQRVITHVHFSEAAPQVRGKNMTARKTTRISLLIFILPPPYIKNKLPLKLLLPWMFR